MNLNKSEKEKETRQAVTLKEKLLPPAYYIAVMVIYLLFSVYTLDLKFNEFLYCNIVLLSAVFGIMLIIVRRAAAAFCASSLLTFALFYVNEFVRDSRMTCIQFRDIYCISDAARVAGGYSPPFDLSIALKLVLLLSMCALVTVFEKKVKGRKRLTAFLTGLVVTAVFSVLTFCSDVQDVFFDVNGFTETNGLPYALLCEYRQSSFDTPENYSAEAVREIYERYKDDEISEGSYDVPNVIFIMNEALTDYEFLRKGIIRDDPLKQLRELAKEDNCKSGYAAVSCYGGITCNTEFEFVSGSSIAFFPYNAIPYLRYMHSGIPSIGRDMTALGADVLGLHPYYGEEWRRNQNYKLLDFPRFIAGEDFSDNANDVKTNGNITDIHLSTVNFGDDLEYIRGFVSDAECYRKVTSEMKAANEKGKSSFIYCITMQNHGGYGDRNTELVAHEYVDDNNALNEYLTLTSISSDAFYDFTRELMEYPEKTVVVMFGDHQPGIDGANFLTDGKNDNIIGIPTYHTNYIVPYYMWANYDLDWEVNDLISINYLTAIVKKNIGLPLTAWDKIRLDAYEEYPAITQDFAVNKNGRTLSADIAVNDPVLNDYICAQYDIFK